MTRVSFLIMWLAAIWLTLSPCIEAGLLLLEANHCKVKSSCCSKSKQEESKSKSVFKNVHCQHHNHAGAKACSDFCKCNCCGHLATAFIPVSTLIFEVPVFSQQPEYRQDYQFDYRHAIWQPPKRV
jgi:hypothetical protein